MKQTNEFIVLREKQHGYFLSKFGNKEGVLSLEGTYVNELNCALFIPYESYLNKKDRIKILAKLLDCEIIKVNAEYTLRHPNGSEVEVIETLSVLDKIHGALSSLDKQLGDHYYGRK
ncbi:hypothetical protein BOVMAS28_11450 [Streptococcus uberis]